MEFFAHGMGGLASGVHRRLRFVVLRARGSQNSLQTPDRAFMLHAHERAHICDAFICDDSKIDGKNTLHKHS